MTDKKSSLKQATPNTLRPVTGLILRITKETPRTKAFILAAPKIAHLAVPGQFIMVWIPGIDEIPMSLSSTDKSTGFIEFTAAKVGDATKALHSKRKGDFLGIRGPLGNGFKFPNSPDNNRLLLVAGGCGSPPIVFAAELAKAKGFDVHVALGATTQTDLLFLHRFKQLAKKLVIATDDGSMGIKGTTVDAATFMLDNDPVYAGCFACGPEGMLYNLAREITKYPILLQMSLERYMKCGVGLCGHCIIDKKGTRVCYEGPVFNAKQLSNTDFGKWTRDETGKRHPSSLNQPSCPS